MEGANMEERKLSISEVAKQVKVENHVLRYWEEELKLEIKRNEKGHRYYTKENVSDFQKIKELKESGLQLKAIRMVLFKTTISSVDNQKQEIVIQRDHFVEEEQQGANEKMARIQYLLKQMITEAVRDNNEELCNTIQSNVVKELDYQFRMRDEADEAREQERIHREEAHFKKIDEVLRLKTEKKGKRKKHSFF